MVLWKFPHSSYNEAFVFGHTLIEVNFMVKTFMLGAAGYPLLELLYRRRTHYSMAIAGGLSLCLIQKISRLHTSLTQKTLLCGCGITAIEYLCGMIWNKQHKVWDYRDIPCNIHGQVCLPYTMLWCGLSACILEMDRHIKKRLAEH